MSKRHQTNRRKSFSRRQHELRERADRRAVAELPDTAWDEPASGSPGDAFTFLGPRAGRIHFALGD